MGLLQNICEDINSYKAFVATLVEKVERLQEEITTEKRLGLYEMDPYNTAGAHQKMGAKPNDTVDFQAPTEPVERPVQHPNANKGPAQRLHAIYDPSKGRVVDVVKAGPQNRPEGEFMEANADQVHNALQHLEKINPRLADMLMNGSINIWIPRNTHTPQNSQMLSQPQSTGTRKVELDPQRLAAAHAAADQMTLAK